MRITNDAICGRAALDAAAERFHERVAVHIAATECGVCFADDRFKCVRHGGQSITPE